MEAASLPERTFEIFRRTVGPATVVSGALFYFGWVRSRAVAAFYGIDIELLNFSTTDLILRSVSTIFPILVATAVLSLASLAVFDRFVLWIASSQGSSHLSVARVQRAGRRLSRFAWLVFAPGLAALFLFETLRGVHDFLPLVGSLLTIVGVALLAGSRRMQTATSVTAAGLEGHAPIETRYTLPLGIAGLAAIFVAVFVIADWRGNQIAVNRANDISGSFPEVVLTSQHELHLFGSEPGRVLTDQGAIAAPWTRQYDGLRLWIEANDRWFLIPDNWRKNQVVHVINIDETVRLDVQR